MFKPRSNTSKVRKRREADSESEASGIDGTVFIDHSSGLKRPKGIKDLPQRTNEVSTEESAPVAVESSSIILLGEDALRHSELHGERSLDSRAQYERVREIQRKIDSGELDEGLYRGMKAYRAYVQPDDERKSANAKLTGAFGPTRGMANVRTTSRFDYQADVCKDYKETGYCGFGDSCKFLHDRSNYKTGWEVERDWDEEARKREQERMEAIVKRMEAQRNGQDPSDIQDGDNSISEKDKCGVCGLFWKDCSSPACVSTCHHYFCEACFLAKCTSTCSKCGKATSGIFNSV